jgi:hypothetical protein
MGYAFHITRADNWFDSEDAPISQDEWERLAGGFPGLREDAYVDWTDIGPQKLYRRRRGKRRRSRGARERSTSRARNTGAIEEGRQRARAAAGRKVQGDDED